MKALIVCVGLLLFAASPVAAASSYHGPIFDTHMHYSRDAWAVFSPGDVFKKMDKANVSTALVSSIPDAGTMKLFELALPAYACLSACLLALPA